MKKTIIKPYLHFIGGNASGVTGSCTILRWQKYKIAVDMGLIQTNNIVADYRANREQIKKIKPKELSAVYCTHIHADHVGGLLLAAHVGMNAHIYLPEGSISLLKIMLEDSVKIMQQDSTKLQNKHGIKAPPLADERDIERVIDRCIEIPFNKPTETFGGIMATFLHAGHIVASSQIVLELKDGYKITKLGFTGDVHTSGISKSVPPINLMGYVNVCVGECTYSDKSRSYSIKKDRWYDEQLMQTAINQYHKILIPTFSLQRLEDILQVLEKLQIKVPIYIDTPLGMKIYRNWPEDLDFESTLNLKFIGDWSESVALQGSNEHCIILASSGMLTAGRAISHLKTILPNANNCILFVGYSAENTLATEIKQGPKEIKVDGEMVQNKAQIYSLNTFSSHANYSQLMDYYSSIRFDNLCLVHSNFESKAEFAKALQDKLSSQAKSSRVICTNADQKIFI